MLETGLVSVTFRRFSPEKIIEICKKTNLTAIEWGGDVHVPPNAFGIAEKIGELTQKAGLKVAAYGSYFRLGNDTSFENILQTAEILQTKIIRVWAGEIGSKEADKSYRNKIIDESKRIADLAANKDISIVYEFHGGTLTDSAESCLDLLETANRENLKTYWQPSMGKNVQANLQDIQIILPFIAGVHVFHWYPSEKERHLLKDGLADWQKYLFKLNKIDGFALLEFVKDDDLKSFEMDAETLKHLVGEFNQKEQY